MMHFMQNLRLDFRILGLALVVSVTTGCFPLGKDVRYTAVYSDKAFGGARENDNRHLQFWHVGTGGEDKKYHIANVFLKLPGGKVLHLREITEDTARKWVMEGRSETLRDESISNSTDKNGYTLTRYNVDNQNIFKFHEGKLAFCLLGITTKNSPLYGVRISSRSDGEFLSFPIEEKDLIRVFGKPDKISKFVNPKAY